MTLTKSTYQTIPLLTHRSLLILRVTGTHQVTMFPVMMIVINRRRRRTELENGVDARRRNTSVTPPRTRRRRQRIVITEEEEEEVEDGNLPLRESSVANCESSRSTFLPTDYADDQPGPSNVKAAPLNVSELISFIDDNASSVSDSPFSEQPSSAAFPDDSDDEAKVDFPRWMRLTQPLRFPYVAQLEDEVVYFRQGHEFYLNAVETRGLYYVTPRLRPLAHLNAEEFCIVEE
ncbi:unnamed protein product, partial [Gongylonema pulchrum]|uniref:WW domain-containing protein n=1 Tax=Gongylonema pulchrum TaxID=637853 RepID=A0A183DK23_9BILA